MGYKTRQVYLNLDPDSFRMSTLDKTKPWAKVDEHSKEPGFRKLITRAREKKKLSQADLAETFKITRAYVNHWERGVSTPPKRLIPRVAQLLGIPVQDLFKAIQLWKLWKHQQRLKMKIEKAGIEMSLATKPRKKAS